jgi:hypothetical protein
MPDKVFAVLHRTMDDVLIALGSLRTLPTTLDPSKRFLADFRGDPAAVFPLCPLMLQKCAARYSGPSHWP